MPRPVGPAIPVPPTRNPFVGKGLRVTLWLVLHPRPWPIRDLAQEVRVSPSLASMVVRELRRRGLVDGAVEQGRPSSVRGTRRLAWELALHWPAPAVGVLGRLPQDGPIGGGPAHQAAGLVTTAVPRRYVRSAEDANVVLGAWGGLLVSPEAADYELCVVDASLDDGLVPPVVVALELGGTPRGRETLSAHADSLLGELPP